MLPISLSIPLLFAAGVGFGYYGRPAGGAAFLSELHPGTMRTAIVGAGVSGLVTARLLGPEHEVTMFEAAGYAGGHANTVRVDTADQTHHVDTGFIVFNDRNYPNFERLLDRLGVASQPSTMTFALVSPYGRRHGAPQPASYVETLRRWRHNFAAHSEELASLGYEERFQGSGSCTWPTARAGSRSGGSATSSCCWPSRCGRSRGARRCGARRSPPPADTDHRQRAQIVLSAASAEP